MPLSVKYPIKYTVTALWKPEAYFTTLTTHCKVLNISVRNGAVELTLAVL